MDWRALERRQRSVQGAAQFHGARGPKNEVHAKASARTPMAQTFLRKAML